ncbi:MAG: hypothetical protein PHP04_03900 [Bacteroidales bacterium]|nr:hypothetical protein [Bacteroidales bacterium]HNW73401.1 hypothetical protein [Bacteroidales bacterium]HPS50771.1 hypothetical protein [Bacteroidales bacterium]
MEGVVVHMLIGLVLFTPIGVIAAWYQDQKAAKKAAEDKKREERLNG